MKTRPSPRSLSPDRRRAFTLIEVLTVIAIIGVLAGIVIQVVGHAKERACQARCAANMRQWVLAAGLYAGDHRGALPFTKYTASTEGEVYITLAPWLDVKPVGNGHNAFAWLKENMTCRPQAKKGGIAGCTDSTPT